MKKTLFLFISLFYLTSFAQFETLPVQSNGRIKPFQTLARENILFLTGKYKFNGLKAEQFYLFIAKDKNIDDLEFINIRSVYAKTKLGLLKQKRWFSIKELSLVPFEAMVGPLLQKAKMDTNNLSPDEKSMVEAYHQYNLALSIKSGEHFLHAVDLSFQQEPNDKLFQSAATFLTNPTSDTFNSLNENSLAQNVPEELKTQLQHINLEVFYNNSRIFLISAIGLLILGIYCVIKYKKNKKIINTLFLFSTCTLLFGFTLRVIITGFAPVTNMYGTMLWVAFGITFFSYLLYLLYSQYILVGTLWLGASFMLLLTENIPLVLSPDLDPIVAVLRSNLWLTIHVLTITISYAAFSICMLLGNYVLIASLFKKISAATLKAIAHSTYRMIQLGVFLLSVGIILGGVWADYSWGRFWGWDPKETWALIADIGFLAILHARYVGWLTEFGIMLAAPAAYLLVIMAWYGVNFILASGLHSYGFSSGGTKIIFTFVVLQVLLLSASLAKKYLKN
ncbi:MAG: cytochrome c biogenesis protein CcsA [Oligoflexia bacterium]|nr:cytochrome c biogenesis protein CcsA [Oligoflexia bacterium]